MLTVIDHVSPWLTPSSRLAPITQPHDGARMSMKGTGRPNSHPATSTLFRVKRWERLPENRLAKAFAIPKLAIKETAAAVVATPNSLSASSGRTERSSPTMPPTNTVTAISKAN